MSDLEAAAALDAADAREVAADWNPVEFRTLGSAYRLSTRWATFVRPEHFDWTWATLCSLYGSGDRHYHTLEHVEDCLRKLDAIREGQVDKRTAEVALFWHDAVYVPGSIRNELASARFLDILDDSKAVHEWLDLQTVFRAIIASKHGSDGQYGNPTVDAVVDIDLSILGESRDVYDLYAGRIRREYSNASDEQWRVGRSKFLREMLARPVIYSLDEMRDRYDAPARKNMAWELSGLQYGAAEGSP